MTTIANAVVRMMGLEQSLEITRASVHHCSSVTGSLLRIATGPPFGLDLIAADECAVGSKFLFEFSGDSPGSILAESAIHSLSALVTPDAGRSTLRLGARQDSSRLELLLYGLLAGSGIAWSMPIAVTLLGSSPPPGWTDAHWLTPLAAALCCVGGLAVSWLLIIQVGRRLARDLNRRGEQALLAIAKSVDAALGPARPSLLRA